MGFSFYFVIISGQIVQQTNDNFKLMEFILKLYSDKSSRNINEESHKLYNFLQFIQATHTQQITKIKATKGNIKCEIKLQIEISKNIYLKFQMFGSDLRLVKVHTTKREINNKIKVK